MRSELHVSAATYQKTLGHLGTTAAELVAAVESVAQLAREAVELTDGLYRPHYTLPK